MYVEEFNLFLQYKQEKHFRILMKMNVKMDSSSLIALYMTQVNIFLYMAWDSQTKVIKAHGFIV